MILAGDMNMRQSEDSFMEQTMGLLEFWKLAGSDRAKKFTWDTVDHGRPFNRFYGDVTRPIHARYDRVYWYNSSSIATPAPTIAQQEINEDKKVDLKNSSMLNVSNFELMANKPVTNEYHFLSDHFGITTTFEVHWPDA